MKRSTVAVVTLVAAAVRPAHAGRLIWSAGVGAAGQAIGDGEGGGPDVAGTVGLEVAPRTSVEAVADVVVEVEERDEGVRLSGHVFAGAGVRVAVVPRLHLALALGVDKVWTQGLVGADAHARVLPAFRVAAGSDVALGRCLRLGVEVGVFAAPLGDEEPTDFPDERIAAAVRLSISGRR